MSKPERIKSVTMEIVKINFEIARSLGLPISQLHESVYEEISDNLAQNIVDVCLSAQGVGNLTSHQISELSTLQIKFRTALLESFNILLCQSHDKKEFKLKRRRWQMCRFMWHIRNGELRRYGFNWFQIWKLCAYRSKDKG